MKKLTALFLVLCMALGMVSLASAEAAGSGQIIYGNITEISGDWAFGAIWTNNATDNMIRGLMDSYSTVVFNKNAELVVNKTVVDGDIKSVLNEDGTKTFTVTVQKDLVFNDETPITAHHFIVSTLLFNHPTLKALGSKANDGEIIVGAKAYEKGEAKTISGLRLIDDYTYSVQVNADKVPFFYELNYAGASPMSIAMWLGDGYSVKDDGEGAYIDGDLSEAALKDKIEKARFLSEGRITAGPYNMVSYDKAAKQAVLELNPHFKGNFEGQKPSVQKIIVTKVESATQFDTLTTGGADILPALTGGDDVNKALDIEKQGGFKTINYARAGYGKLQFVCDFGPTQFKNVRHAVAHLLNRPDFANTFTGGYGSLVHGPYGVASWMYQEAEEELGEKLNEYSYSLDEAKKVLEEDGWVLAADGSEYKEGIRYKEVTAEEAGDYKHNVKVGDKILMPLIIEWASTANNPVSELLSTMLAKNPDVAAAGMQINQAIMDFPELLNWMYRDTSVDARYGVKTYGMMNLASNFPPGYTEAYAFTVDPEKVKQGFNDNFILDETLDKLSMDMVFGRDPSDKEGYLKTWVEFMVRWNELLPDLPLYSNIYYTIFTDKLENYEETPYWGFEKAIVYANMK